jgi:hypothetical protein
MQLNVTEEAFKNALKPYWNNRILFDRKVLGSTRHDPQQDELLRSLDTNDHVTVKAGHHTGKTSGMAKVILHYICTRPRCKIPCTAPTKHQLFDVLWPELSKWYNEMKKTETGMLFARNLVWNKESFVNTLCPAEWFAVPRTATKEKPEGLQGFHADYMLKLIDEASGVSDEVSEVLEGATGEYETKSMLTANPTRLDGFFYRSHTDPKEMEFFKRITMDCEKSTLTPKRYIERMAAKYGTHSNIYKIRVKGSFPDSEGDSYIPLSWAEGAYLRDIPVMPNFKRVLGVDVARNAGTGDRTVIADRQGDYFHPYHVMMTNDTMKIVNYVAAYAKKVKAEAIFVDVIGYGAGVFDRLKELGFNVIAVNVAETRSMEFPERYCRLRDELWGKMRDWLEVGRGRIWDNEDKDLIGELSLPQMDTKTGKIKIESKEEMKLRCPGVGSPDIADAHIMTFASPMADYDTSLDKSEDDDYNNDGWKNLDDKAGY